MSLVFCDFCLDLVEEYERKNACCAAKFSTYETSAKQESCLPKKKEMRMVSSITCPFHYLISFEPLFNRSKRGVCVAFVKSVSRMLRKRAYKKRLPRVRGDPRSSYHMFATCDLPDLPFSPCTRVGYSIVPAALISVLRALEAAGARSRDGFHVLRGGPAGPRGASQRLASCH